MDPTEGMLTIDSYNNFIWDIPNFKALPDMVGYYLDSPPFPWENVTWCLRLYPSGRSIRDFGWMFLGLVKLNGPRLRSEPQPVYFKLGMMRRDSCVLQEFKDSGIFYVNNQMHGGCLLSINKARAEMESTVPNFEVSFSCTLDSFQQNRRTPSISSRNKTM